MKTVLALVLSALAAQAAASTDLDEAIRRAPRESWLAYAVPMIATDGSPCCYSWHDGKAQRRGCKLANSGWTFNDDDREHAAASGELVVYLHVADGGADRVRAYAADCPVDTAGERVANLTDVDPARSVAVLARLAEAPQKRHHGEAIGALALHAGSASDATLSALAGSGHERSVRKDASFWLGQTRGQAGFDTVRRMFGQESDEQLRQHWVFVFAQSKVPARAAVLREIARSDRTPKVRGDALFWMSQSDIAGVEDEVRRTLREDDSAHVRKQAVFALSQLPAKRSVPALRALAEDKALPRAIRREALFWLAQTDDDAAFAVFDQILR